MFVVKKGVTSTGIDIQIEDWSDVYPNLFKKNATVGFYPKAVNDIYNEDYPHWAPYPKRGEVFRASLNFDTEEEAREAFNAMRSGEKTYMDYLDNYSSHVISKKNFIRAVTC